MGAVVAGRSTLSIFGKKTPVGGALGWAVWLGLAEGWARCFGLCGGGEGAPVSIFSKQKEGAGRGVFDGLALGG